MITKIDIQFIPKGAQRYDTLGDWTIDGDTLSIRSSGDGEHDAFLVALHELVEAWLCQANGIDQAVVDAFDLAFKGDGEPGDDPKSPYRHEHRKAMIVEVLVANFLGLSNYGTVA